MRVEEVRAALGRPVQFRSVKLACDSVYVLTGCILRRGTDGFYYQAELTRGRTVIVASLDDIERVQAPAAPHITHQQAHNAYDMLHGACNRMFVTDDPAEPARLYASALHLVETIYAYARGRFAEKEV